MLRDADQLARWVSMAKDGDEEAYDQLLKACYPGLFRTIFEIVPCFQDVEEILQDAFYRLYRSLGALRENEDPYPFLRRIAVRRAYTFLKHNRRRTVSIEDVPVDAPELVVKGRSLPLRSVYGWAAKLSPKRRLVFLLREVLGFSDKEIAGILSISETTVRRHASMAKEQLIKEATEGGEGY